jgi:hypothetical protein
LRCAAAGHPLARNRKFESISLQWRV